MVTLKCSSGCVRTAGPAQHFSASFIQLRAAHQAERTCCTAVLIISYIVSVDRLLRRSLATIIANSCSTSGSKGFQSTPSESRALPFIGSIIDRLPPAATRLRAMAKYALETDLFTSILACESTESTCRSTV